VATGALRVGPTAAFTDSKTFPAIDTVIPVLAAVCQFHFKARKLAEKQSAPARQPPAMPAREFLNASHTARETWMPRQ
jgi:hypothetical protein